MKREKAETWDKASVHTYLALWPQFGQVVADPQTNTLFPDWLKLTLALEAV